MKKIEILTLDEAFDLAESVGKIAPYAGYGIETPKGFLRCVRTGNTADPFDRRSEFQLVPKGYSEESSVS